MKLASCKSALNPTVVYPVLVLLFVALWFILRGDMFYVLPFVILFLFFFFFFFCFFFFFFFCFFFFFVFSVLLAL